MKVRVLCPVCEAVQEQCRVAYTIQNNPQNRTTVILPKYISYFVFIGWDVLNSEFLCSTFSSTTPPPNVRIVNGYVTVQPPLTHQEQHRRMEMYTTEQQPSTPSSTPPDPSSAQPALVHSTLTLSCLLAWLLSHILFIC